MCTHVCFNSKWIKIRKITRYLPLALVSVKVFSLSTHTHTHKAFDRWWAPVYIGVVFVVIVAEDVVVIITCQSHSHRDVVSRNMHNQKLLLTDFDQPKSKCSSMALQSTRADMVDMVYCLPLSADSFHKKNVFRSIESSRLTAGPNKSSLLCVWFWFLIFGFRTHGPPARRSKANLFFLGACVGERSFCSAFRPFHRFRYFLIFWSALR